MQRIVKSVDYDYVERRKIIDKLCFENPVLQEFSLGKSCAGHDITALKINSENGEYVLFVAAFHGSEHITANVLLAFVEDFSAAYTKNGSLAGIKIRKALGKRGVIFVPCVNPDGCEISIRGASACGNFADKIYSICQGKFEKWNSNLRGVDINHNFDADWEKLHELERKSGIFGPSPTRFGGYSPESEPETAALVNLCKNSYIKHSMALHSQGEVIYWNYKGYEPKISKQMAEIMAATSGYALDVPVGLATGGGFKDWFLKEFNRPAFTIEIGKGENPLPIETAEKLYNDIQETLTITAIM